jgi:hypothetical protein
MMEEHDFVGTCTETEELDDTPSEPETIAFISLDMLDRLMAMKMAEGHDSFESLFEQLLADHEVAKELRARMQ